MNIKKLLMLVLALGLFFVFMGAIFSNKETPKVGKDSPKSGKDIKTAPEENSLGWAIWKKNTDPVFSGPYHLVGDPSVMKDGNLYRMFYNCYDPEKHWGAVCEVTSNDGFSWEPVDVKDSIPGRVIHTGGEGAWDTAHETPLIYKYKGEYFLYFTGYIHKGDFGKSFPYHVGLATSDDGVHFKKYGNGPLFSPTKGGYDNDAVFSPTITEYNNKLVMVYTGMCMTACGKESGVHLLGATSDDGKIWTKVTEPIISVDDVKEKIPQAKDGIAESDIVKGPDGYYYLFMSLLYGNNGHEVGVARATTPFGPWDINPNTIVQKSKDGFDAIGPIAPTVIFDGGKAKMWFHGFGGKTIDIGYAEAELPLKQ